MKSECRKPFQDRGEIGFSGVFWVVLNIHLCMDTVISFMFVFPSNKLSAWYRGTKGWAIIHPSLGQITIHQWFAISEYDAVMLFEPRIERKKIKPAPTTLKGINKCIEKEKGHKHWGFYSECRDADASTECTWRAKLRAAEDERNPRELSGGARERWLYSDLSTIHLHSSYWISNIVGFKEDRLSCHNEADSAPVAPFSFSVWSHKVLSVFCKQYSRAAALI